MTPEEKAIEAAAMKAVKEALEDCDRWLEKLPGRGGPMPTLGDLASGTHEPRDHELEGPPIPWTGAREVLDNGEFA